MLLLAIFAYVHVNGQNIALKTNALYGVTATPNVGVEIAIGERLSLDVSGGYNPWTFSDNKKWKHWVAQPEFRYWTCQKMNGHFFAAHLLGGQYNVGNVDFGVKWPTADFTKLKAYRYEGWFAGMGLAYGYAWMLGRSWNLEAELGLGYAYSSSDKFECADCGYRVESGISHSYVGPTKAAINLVYVF